MNRFKGTPGPWSQGYLLNTPTTNKWSDEDRRRMDYSERLRVVSDFTADDQGRSRKLVATCTTPEDAKLISASKELLEALQGIVEDVETKINASIRAADRHNNTAGVGIDFDYMSVPPPPKWFAAAKAAISKALD